MKRIQRSTTTYPDTIEEARQDYEVRGLGYRRLSRKYSIPHATIAYLAKSRKWMKLGSPPPGLPEGYIAARDVGTAILAEGLRNRLRAGPPPTEMPANPAMKRGRGRPRKHPRSEENPAEPIQSRQSAADPSALEPTSFDRYSSEAVAPVSPKDTLSPPLPDAQDRIGGKGAKVSETATVIPFPGPTPSPREQPDGIQVLPELTREEKAALRVTLATIRATIALEQVEQLEHHEGLLRLYSHLIEVYLEPRRFLELDGLDDDAKADKIVAAQQLALRTLLPTERDTLVGAIKTLTNSLHANIVLKRAVVGLHTMKGGARQPPSDPLEEKAEPGGKIADYSTLSPEQKCKVQAAMEIMQQLQHQQREASKPPLPESNEDLRNPDFPLKSVEPGDPDIAPR